MWYACECVSGHHLFLHPRREFIDSVAESIRANVMTKHLSELKLEHVQQITRAKLTFVSIWEDHG